MHAQKHSVGNLMHSVFFSDGGRKDDYDVME